MLKTAYGIVSSDMTHVGLVRVCNEDSLLAMPEAGLWAIADGMGGHEAGDYASQCVILHLQRVAQAFVGVDLVERLAGAIEAANHELYEYSRSLGEHGIVGTTVVVLVLEGESFHCFWTGDSRCYLMRNDSLQMLSCDHADEDGLLHGIGVDPQPYIDYVQGDIYEWDRFYLCSDGVNKVISDQQLEISLKQHSEDIDQVNNRLIYDALRRGAPDNISSIIVDV